MILDNESQLIYNDKRVEQFFLYISEPPWHTNNAIVAMVSVPVNLNGTDSIDAVSVLPAAYQKEDR